MNIHIIVEYKPQKMYIEENRPVYDARRCWPIVRHLCVKEGGWTDRKHCRIDPDSFHASWGTYPFQRWAQIVCCNPCNACINTSASGWKNCTVLTLSPCVTAIQLSRPVTTICCQRREFGVFWSNPACRHSSQFKRGSSQCIPVTPSNTNNKSVLDVLPPVPCDCIQFSTNANVSAACGMD